MGDASDMADIERFLRCEAGQHHLQDIAGMLKGHTILDVRFQNGGHCVITTLQLDGGATFDLWQPSLEVEALREEFPEALDEEYYKDYPGRRPKEAP